MPPDLDLTRACTQAGEWVRAAADIARRHFGSDLAVSIKPDNSLLTEIDLEVQTHLTSAILGTHPDHAVLGEEHTPTPVGPRCARYTWVIDPIDGTRNYALGFPSFATALALCDGPRPVIGIIYDPLGERFFEATLGGGAAVNGRPMQAASSAQRRDLLLAFPGGRKLSVPQALFDTFGRRVNLRNLGSTCLHMALVAAGALDGAYGYRAKLWDVAAGAVMIAEAGGVFTTVNGGALFPLQPAAYDGEDLPFIAASSDIHAEFVDAVASAAART